MIRFVPALLGDGSNEESRCIAFDLRTLCGDDGKWLVSFLCSPSFYFPQYRDTKYDVRQQLFRNSLLSRI